MYMENSLLVALETQRGSIRRFGDLWQPITDGTLLE